MKDQNPGTEMVPAKLEIQLIENTSLEKLASRIQAENQKRLNKLGGHRDLVTTIISVYNFLTAGLGMIPGELSLKDFEAGEAELKKLAGQKIKEAKEKPAPGFWNRLFGSGNNLTQWEYFLERGYFSPRVNPFRSRIYCESLTNQFEVFDPEDFFDHCDHKNRHAHRSSHEKGEFDPTNLRQLYKQLRVKRCLKSSKLPG